MDAIEKVDVVRGIRRLTIAVWALVLAIGLIIGIYVYSKYDSSKSHLPIGGITYSEGKPFLEWYKEFYDWPLQKQIDSATAIAVAKYQKDGDHSRCVITEILKQPPDRVLRYKSGDEHQQCSRGPNEPVPTGDGQLIFFVDTPPTFKFSISIIEGRVPGMRDISIEELRNQVNKEKELFGKISNLSFDPGTSCRSI